MKDTRIFNEDVLEVSVIKKEDACEGAGKTNIFIASFTTALACLKLYEKLESWVNKSFTTIPIQSFIDGKKVSPMFLQADELEGDPIVEFGSAGPKCY